MPWQASNPWGLRGVFAPGKLYHNLQMKQGKTLITSAEAIPATDCRHKYKKPTARQNGAGRGSALCCLRCPPRHVHGEAGQVVTDSAHSIAEAGIWMVNERLESVPCPRANRVWTTKMVYNVPTTIRQGATL